LEVILDNNKVLKNSLLRFAGGNVEWDCDWDEGNEKKMAERIVAMLDKFEELVRVHGGTGKLWRDQEMEAYRKNKEPKTQEALLYNSDRTDGQLFKTFSDWSLSESRPITKESQFRIEIPIAVKTYSKEQSRDGSEPELQFEKLDLAVKCAPEAFSDLDSDVMKLVQEKTILQQKGKQTKMRKATSSSDCSMEMLEEGNELGRNESSYSKSSNLWVKELDYQMKLDSCIFE
jgi:hypothetical protein